MVVLTYGSDLHFEVGTKDVIEALEKSDGDILVLAGDICTERVYSRFNNPLSPLGNFTKEFYDLASKKYKHVIVIAGNHEYYGGKLLDTDNIIREAFSCYDNVHFLQDEPFYYEDIAFYGTTMWTPMGYQNHLIESKIQMGMNDFHYIRRGNGQYRKIVPADVRKLHDASLIKFYQWSKGISNDKKIVLIQHHAPSRFSISTQYKGNEMNEAYFSVKQEELIALMGTARNPDTIIHGHMHNRSFYNFMGVEVLCNPRGYEGHEESAEEFEFQTKII